MKTLVTGGAGFIGSNLTDRLIREGHKVVILDNLCTGKKEHLNPKAIFYNIDIQNPGIYRIFKKEKPDIVFHCAAQIDIRKSVADPVEDAKTNIMGSLSLIENFIKIKSKNKKFIFISTGGALYGDAKVIPTPEDYPAYPLSPYGVAKLTIERYLNYYHKVFGLNYVVLRLANVYGPRQNSEGEAGVVAIFCGKMLSGVRPIINGTGNKTRDFVFVQDVVEACVLAMRKNRVGILNIGTSKETTINTIFRKLRKLTGINYEEIHGPDKAGEQKRSCLDFKKAKKELGWTPKYNLDKGLEITVDWFMNKNNKKF